MSEHARTRIHTLSLSVFLSLSSGPTQKCVLHSASKFLRRQSNLQVDLEKNRNIEATLVLKGVNETTPNVPQYYFTIEFSAAGIAQ